MLLEQLIVRPIESLPPSANCVQAARLMRDENIGAVVVAQDRRPVGMVTDRDLVQRVLAAGEDPQRTTLADVMTGQPVFLASSRTLAEAIQTMRELSIRRIPVVDETGALCGMVSMDDAIIQIAERLGGVAETIRKEIGLPK
ncbi:MAG: CBS domain-containing protein [Proteobacteria bacterium]|nr:CBS domain-containing protein [Pseudomonadota bacterium]